MSCLGSSEIGGARCQGRPYLRDPIVRSCGLFGLTTLLGSFFFGSRVFFLILLAEALAHCSFVMIREARADRRFVLGHVFVVSSSLLAVFSYVLLSVGYHRGGFSKALSLLAVGWSDPHRAASFAQYAAIRLSIIGLVALVAMSVTARRGFRARPWRALLIAGASVNLPCDYAWYRPLFRIGVYRLETSQHFVFAAGVLGLEYPLYLLLIVTIVVGVWQTRRGPCLSSGHPRRD